MVFVAVFAMDLNSKVYVGVSRAATKEKKQRRQEAKELKTAAKAQAYGFQTLADPQVTAYQYQGTYFSSISRSLFGCTCSPNCLLDTIKFNTVLLPWLLLEKFPYPLCSVQYVTSYGREANRDAKTQHHPGGSLREGFQIARA